MLSIYVILLFISCVSKLPKDKNGKVEKETPVTIIGTWKLVEELFDIGDGSSVFKKTESNKMITFFSDGTLKSNMSLCYSANNTTKRNEGTYSIKDKTITYTGCRTKVSYVIKSNELILNLHCIEPCFEKFVRISS